MMSIELTILSTICIIPNGLLPSRAHFRLYKQYKDNINSKQENKKCVKMMQKHKCQLIKDYFNIIFVYTDEKRF